MTATLGLVERIHALHRAFEAAGLRHAFGGALALAWCTTQARATNDIDVNVFVSAQDAGKVLAALPAEVEVAEDTLAHLERQEQARAWWDMVAIDIFLGCDDFYAEAAERSVRWELGGIAIPFLACRDLAAFKAFFDRAKDWVDIEEMLVVASFDVEDVCAEFAQLLGPDDHRIARLRALHEKAAPAKEGGNP